MTSKCISGKIASTEVAKAMVPGCKTMKEAETPPDRPRPGESQAEQERSDESIAAIGESTTGQSLASADVWSLKEGELRPEHVRALGIYFYRRLFQRLLVYKHKDSYELGGFTSNPDLDSFNYYREHESPPDITLEPRCAKFIPGYVDGEYLNWVKLNSQPAELYVENFANAYGLPVEALKRWTAAASQEIAEATSLHYERGEYKRGNRSDKIIYDHWAEHGIAAARHIQQAGLAASIEDHETVLDFALNRRLSVIVGVSQDDV